MHGAARRRRPRRSTRRRSSSARIIAPAAANLADLYRQLGREADAESVLRQALETSPQDAGLHHALGLALVRLKREDEALAELRRAAELEPDRARYAYVYAVGLDSSGRRSDAIQVLKDNVARHPDDRDTLLALIGFNREAGDAASGAPIRRAARAPGAVKHRAQELDRDAAAASVAAPAQ